ncbi:MAG: hypothetical protein PHS41_07720 [Victivallaceae bacterium]|nr:hypothetical protein [Victivallaceae bacterium]
MKKHCIRPFRLLLWSLAAGAVFFLVSCASVVEIPGPPGITLTQLQKKIREASDPDGRLEKATSYLQTQEIIEPGFWGDRHSMIEVRFKEPDKLKITSFSENIPQYAVLVNGGAAWRIDYERRKVVPLSGEVLETLEMLARLDRPDTSYESILDGIKLSLCRIDGALYYRVKGRGKGPGKRSMEIFINQSSNLVRRVVLRQKGMTSTSDIRRYGLYDAVMVPEVTVVTVVTDPAGEHTNRLLSYRLNVEFSDDEFLPPVFPAN